jgi:predicted DNA-binding transcriptional regulator AlpA
MDSHRLQFEQLRSSLLITATKREFMEREIWRIGKVMKATGLSRTTIWRMEKKGRFPGRVQISERNIGWYSDEIMDFVNQRQRKAVGGA